MIFDLDHDRIRHRPGIKWGRHGPEVLAAWVADMDIELPDVIVDAVVARIRGGGLGYDFYDEPIPVLDCLVERMRDRFDWHIDVADVIRLHDVIQGLVLAIDTLTEPGDGIVVQTPIYPPFLSSITGADRRVLANPLGHMDGGYRLDVDQLDELVASENARVLLLCNPHNPCGRAFTEPELQAMADVAARHDLIVISDEIHLDLVYSPHRHIPFARLGPDAADRTVTLTAATKSFNMAGIRMAFLHTSSPRLRERIDRVPTRLLGGIGILGQVATIAGWTEGQPWLDELVAGLDHNRHLLAELLDEHLPGARYVPPDATYLAWVDCRDLGLGDNPAEVFLDHGVAVNSGLDFGPGGEGFARINFATSPDMLTSVVERMGRAVA